MARAQQGKRPAHCKRCGTRGIRTHRDFFKRKLGVVIGVALLYFCPRCERVFQKLWSL